MKRNRMALLIGIIICGLSIFTINSYNSNKINKGVVQTAENQYNSGSNSDNNAYSTGLKYELITEGSTTYASVSRGDNTSTTIRFPDYYSSDGTTNYPVTTIADYGFYKISDVTAYYFSTGSQITTIGEYAFAFNTNSNFSNITLPSNLEVLETGAFFRCTTLYTLNWGDGSGATVTTINDSAFENCKNLNNIDIPVGCTYYGKSSFRNTGLERIIFPNTLENIQIMDYAFSDCGSLSVLYLPTNVITINNYAFYGVSSTAIIYSNAANEAALTTGTGKTFGANYRNYSYSNKITFYSEQVVDAADDDFYLYLKETEGWIIIKYKGTATNYPDKGSGGTAGILTIPSLRNTNEKIVRIASKAFENHEELTNITLPTDLVYIDEYAFSGCKNLTTISFPANNTLTTIGNYAFYTGGSISAYNQALVIPYSVQTIGNYAFNNYSSATGFSIQNTTDNPSQLTTIGEHAFDCICYYLIGTGNEITVTFPKSITNIKNYAFNYAGIANVIFEEGATSRLTMVNPFCGISSTTSPLKSVTFRNTALTITGDHSFYGQFQLEHLYFPSNVLATNLGQYIFQNTIVKLYFSNSTKKQNFYNTNFNNNSCRAFYTESLTVNNTTGQQNYAMNGDGINPCHNNIPNYGGTVDYTGTEVFLPAYYGVTSEDSILTYTYNNIAAFEYVVLDNVVIVTNLINTSRNTLTTLVIPETIDGVTVTKIGAEAFMRSKLETVKLPSTITAIQTSAFYASAYLNYIGTNDIVANAESIMPASLKNVGSTAFYATAITTMTFPTTCTLDYMGVFMTYGACLNLTAVHFKGKTTSDLYYDSGDGTETNETGCIYDHKTANQTKLRFVPISLSGALTVPEGVTMVLSDSLKWNHGLTSISFPNTLTTIQTVAFKNDQSRDLTKPLVESITFNKTESTLKTIESSAFQSLRNLTRFDFPDSLTAIGNGAFSGCYNLKASNNLATDTNSAGTIKFYSCQTKSDVETDTVTGNFTAFDTNAFGGCNSIQRVFLPKSLINLPENTFTGNSSISVFFPYSYTTKIAKNFNNNYAPSGRTEYHYWANTTTLEDPTTTNDLNYWYYDSSNVVYTYTTTVTNGVRAISSGPTAQVY